jgi:hypothetical protein
VIRKFKSCSGRFTLSTTTGIFKIGTRIIIHDYQGNRLPL